jgi:membrane protease YdiL (CAAX protease family)
MHEIGIAGALFLVLFGVVLPFKVIQAGRRQAVAGATTPPPRSRYFVAVLINQAVFLVLALLAARVERVDIFATGSITPSSILLAACLLAAAVASVPIRWRFTPDGERRRLLAARPAQPSDLGPWFLVSASAGFVEEIVYRGVMFVLLYRLTGSWGVSAALCIVAFVLAHGGRGWHRLLVIGLLAIAFHALVRLTETLYLAMALHFLYDFIAGVIYLALGKRMAATPAG